MKVSSAQPASSPDAASELPTAHCGDHPALDLLNSVARLGGQEIEFLSDGAALIRWLKATLPLLNLPVGSGGESASKRELDEIAAEIRLLREWLRTFIRRHAGAPLTLEALAAIQPLNDVLETDSAFRVIVASGGEPAWSAWRRPGIRKSLLQPVAHTIGDLITEVDFSRVRPCAGEGCTLWFFDRTRGGVRRWCSMALCGNRSKAAHHRARHRAADRSPNSA